LSGKTHFLISCEHGGNRIPSCYRKFFPGFGPLLRSHRGYDRGALHMARDFAGMLHAPLVAGTKSRLLVDLNRNIGHPTLFSEATRNAPAAVRKEILERCYLPYRNTVERNIAEAVSAGKKVIHISPHSFTPELNGEIRNADIGLLYDPSRLPERTLCRRWQASLKACAPDLVVRCNYPYTGKVNGFPTYLRRRFPADAYVGIELEINQKHVLKGGGSWREFRSLVIESLIESLNEVIA
jgi:predicted N-formylglutamate amidohydrolase